MSSSKNPGPKLPRSDSSSPIRPQPQVDLPPEHVPLADTPMDQHSSSTLIMDAFTASSSSEVTSPTPPKRPHAPAPQEIVEAVEPTPETYAHPIPPASEPMQYRAIGLIRARYSPSDEQFTRGMMTTEDGTQIDAVLLGRVMSLVKKHLDLADSHLWVVYPRTREQDNALHVQVVGVWEPETLNREQSDDADDADMAMSEAIDESDDDLDSEELDSTELDAIDDSLDDVDEPDDDAAEPIADASVEEALEADASIVESDSKAAPLEEEPEAKADEAQSAIADSDASTEPPKAQPQDGYFSVRGEVVYYSADEQRVVVKIQQAPKKPSTTPRAFKLTLKGLLDGKTLGYFWDFQVQREEGLLVVQDSSMIAMVPPKRRGKGGGGGSGGRRPRPGGRPSGGPRGGNRPGNNRPRWEGSKGGGDRRPPSGNSSGGGRREPIQKPIKRPKDTSA